MAIVVLRPTPDPTICSAYGISNLVCSCSYEPEAFGRVSVEAQSMEKPIIASNIGGSKETIIDDKTGFLFDAQKPEEKKNDDDEEEPKQGGFGFFGGKRKRRRTRRKSKKSRKNKRKTRRH